MIFLPHELFVRSSLLICTAVVCSFPSLWRSNADRWKLVAKHSFASRCVLHFMWSSVEIYINHENSSSHLDLKTRFLGLENCWGSTSFFFLCPIDEVCVGFVLAGWKTLNSVGWTHSPIRQNGELMKHVGISKIVAKMFLCLWNSCAQRSVRPFRFLIAKYAHVCVNGNPAEWKLHLGFGTQKCPFPLNRGVLICL